jgi:hypothetical protein
MAGVGEPLRHGQARCPDAIITGQWPRGRRQTDARPASSRPVRRPSRHSSMSIRPGCPGRGGAGPGADRPRPAPVPAPLDRRPALFLPCWTGGRPCPGPRCGAGRGVAAGPARSGPARRRRRAHGEVTRAGPARWGVRDRWVVAVPLAGAARLPEPCAVAHADPPSGAKRHRLSALTSACAICALGRRDAWDPPKDVMTNV